MRVQAGVLLGELDRETQAFGLAVPSGIVTHTGVAGLTLGGGIGWIMRKHGLSVDQLVSMDLVTADGEFVKASEDENADLFWGLCGGGGNFGIVTEFEFRCVPLGTQVLAGPIFWPMQQSGEVLRFYRDWVADAPDELMTIVLHRKAPPLPFVPDELHGKPVVMVVPCWVGDLEEGEKFIKPLREFGPPVADVCMVKPYLAHQAMFDPSFVPGRWYYFKSCDVAELNDEIIDITVERSLQIESPLTSFPIWQMGGAVSRVGDDDTAFNGRTAAFTYNIGACTADERRLRPRARVGAQLLVRPRAVARGRVRELPRRRGRRPGSPGVRAAEVRTAACAEAEVRPGQLLPDQPEHPAELSEGPRVGALRLIARYGETRRTLSADEGHCLQHDRARAGLERADLELRRPRVLQVVSGHRRASGVVHHERCALPGGRPVVHRELVPRRQLQVARHPALEGDGRRGALTGDGKPAAIRLDEVDVVAGSDALQLGERGDALSVDHDLEPSRGHVVGRGGCT